jgi:predicted solute-binding protein
MNISNTILQIMGMEIAAKLIDTTVRKRYLDALEKGIIYFTKRQNLNINYTKQYDKLRKAKTSDERKLINKNITKLREAIFKL